MNLLLHPASRALAPALLLGLALGGCLTGESSIGEPHDGGASSSDATGSDDDPTSAGSTTEGSAPGSDDTGASSGELPPPSCPPSSQCSVPLECEPEGFEACGGILSRSNEDGCPRQPCSGPGQCPAGSSCLLPNAWSECGFHGCFDDPATGQCECGFGLDCNNNGLCVPDEEGLPPDTDGPTFCGQHADAASCEGAALPAELGACRWYEGWQMPAGAACEERVELAQCVYIKRRGFALPLTSCPSDETLTPVVRNEDGLLTVLLLDLEDPLPVSLEYDTYFWDTCDFAGTEAECECGCP